MCILLEFFGGHNIAHRVPLLYTDKSSYSFQDRKVLFCRSIVHTGTVYISDVYVTWILIFDHLCKKIPTVKLSHVFCKYWI